MAGRFGIGADNFPDDALRVGRTRVLRTYVSATKAWSAFNPVCYLDVGLHIAPKRPGNQAIRQNLQCAH